MRELEKSNDEIITELGTEAIINYERITALYYLLEDKGLITHEEFDKKFKEVHQHYRDHVKAIFGDEIEVE
ncbi:hypothetical protein EWH99_01385 [Sporolactobacillus sp. THM7-7]|nr:hypothetical protein EWH99_01385 [Sporolactobacillus sp. THM7-7]